MRKAPPKPHGFRDHREAHRARHLASVAVVLALLERRT